MLDIPPDEIADAFETGGPRITIAEVDAETAYRVMERRRQLPGVVVELVPARVYPEGDVLAHVLGHIGRPSEEDVAERPDIDPNVIIGKAGVERTYDEFLQGDPGTVSYRINARNQVIRELREIPPTQGDTIYLTIDLEIQRELEEVLEGVIDLSNEVKAAAEDEYFLHTTERAAGMVLDPKTGEVLAMASYPDFDPSVFVGGLSQNEFESLNESQAFNNLVIQGEYAPASTFKAVGYVTALEEQMWPEDVTIPGPDGTVECDGRIEFPFGDGSQEVLYDWYHPDDLRLARPPHLARPLLQHLLLEGGAEDLARLQGDRAGEPPPGLGQGDGVRLHQRDRPPLRARRPRAGPRPVRGSRRRRRHPQHRAGRAVT